MGDESAHEDGSVYLDGPNIWERRKRHSANSLSVLCDNPWGRRVQSK
ncbi:Uncharacterised protein [Vibrio cholerae]|nr:Uncharacterised protein [Vibrio cholerae]